MQTCATCSLIAVLLFSVIDHADAEPVNYKCTVAAVYTVASDGRLKEAPLFKVLPQPMGEFMVDRISGAIAGDFIPNRQAISVKVVMPGNEANAFRVLSTFPTGMVEVLEVKEFVDGKSKPFVALGFNGVVTGTCR